MKGEEYMAIVLIRVDDRLIHGQVAAGWSRATGATHIVVADDAVAADGTQKALLKVATPTGIKSSILSVEGAAELLKGSKLTKDKVIVLVRGPSGLLRLRDLGIELKQVNIGNVRMADGRQRLSKEIAATPEEVEQWKTLDSLGIEMTAQWVPGGPSSSFNQVLRDF